VLARENQRFFIERQCMVRLAIFHWNLGNILKSSEHFLEAQRAFHRVEDKRSEEFCSKCLDIIRLYTQGKEARSGKDSSRSLSLFKQAIVLARETGFAGFELKCLRQQGITYWETRNLDAFLDCNRKALALSIELEHKNEEGRCLNNIGVYYQKTGQYPLAVSYLKRALVRLKHEKDKATEAECMNNLAVSYRDLGDFVKAVSYLSRALEIDKKLGDPISISADLGNLASLHLRRGIDKNDHEALKSALNYYQESIGTERGAPIEPYLEVVALNNKGVILNELGEYSKAHACFETALRVFSQNELSFERCCVLNNMASAYLYENNVEKALLLYEVAHELSTAHSYASAVLESCVGLGQCYEKRQKYSLALLFYQMASEALESQIGQLSSDIYMIGFARNKNDVYHRMLRILVDQYVARPSEVLFGKIFNVVERAKAKAFLETLNKGQQKNDLVHLRNLTERNRLVSRDISEPCKRLARGEDHPDNDQNTRDEIEFKTLEYEQMLSEIRMTENGRFDGLKDRICGLDEVRQQIVEEGTILLEYILGDDRSYLLSLTSRTARLSILPNRVKIERSLRAYLKAISEVNIGERSRFSASKRVGREIIPPEIINLLGEFKAIIVIPDGILNYLPFETIRIHDGAREKYLIESFAISYCPSASTLRMLTGGSQKKEWKKTILAIGGPKYGDYPGPNAASSGRHLDTEEDPSLVRKMAFAELPFSGKEAIDVGGLFPKEEAQVITGRAVSEEIVKKLPLWEFQIIHFSCHGYLDEANPMRTALVLTPGPSQEEDGFLRMEEIYKLSLDADIVVLSACQTGKGLLEKGEGVMSLTRPFFIAGARSVIAALWPINDKSTAGFMKEFYKLIIKGRSVNEALRSVKLKMIRSSWSHPFYWSGFILQGNPTLVRTPHPIS
jgi:CHAT domain-containing protein/Flp pilus assembly protein TadD